MKNLHLLCLLGFALLWVGQSLTFAQNTPQGELQLVPPVGHSGWISSMAFSPDGKWVVTASKDSTLRLWEVATRREVRVFSGHESELYNVAFSPDSARILSGGLDNTLR